MPPRFIAYGEAPLPEDRTAVPRPERAYDNVDYALYFGTEERRDALIFAGTDELPLEGQRASTELRFGDQVFLLVFTPRSNLGGWLLANLYWIILALGVVVAVAVALLVEWMAAPPGSGRGAGE